MNNNRDKKSTNKRRKTQEFAFERKKYESIEIPEELSFVVNRAILQSGKKKKAKIRKLAIRVATSAAAIVLAVFVVGVNTSYAFAKTAKQIPVVEKVAKATCVRSYSAQIAADPEPLEYDVIKLQKSEEKARAKEQASTDDPEEIVTISGQNQEEVTIPEEKEPEVVEMTLEYWLDHITAEQLRNVTEQYSLEYEEANKEHPEKLETILLTEVKEFDVAVYGYHKDGSRDGMAVRIGNSVQTFDLTYMKQGGRVPDVVINESSDSKDIQIAMTIYNLSEQNELSLESKEVKEDTKSDIQTKDGETITSEEGMSDSSNATTETAVSSDGAAENVATDEENNKETAAIDNQISKDDTEVAEGSEEGSVEEEKTVVSELPPKGKLWVIQAELEDAEKKTYYIHAKELKDQDITDMIKEVLKADYDETSKELSISLIDSQKEKTFDLSEVEKAYVRTVISIDKWYVLRDKMEVYFGLSVEFEDDSVDSSMMPLMKAEVVYDGAFKIINVSFCE